MLVTCIDGCIQLSHKLLNVLGLLYDCSFVQSVLRCACVVCFLMRQLHCPQSGIADAQWNGFEMLCLRGPIQELRKLKLGDVIGSNVVPSVHTCHCEASLASLTTGASMAEGLDSLS